MTLPHDSSPTARRPMILIATDDITSAEDIGGYLGLRGFDARISAFDGYTLKRTPVKAPDAIVLVFKTHCKATANLAKALKAHYQPRSIPVITAMPHDETLRDPVFDSMLFEPVHAAQIATRVQAIVRLNTMETEIHRRIETLKSDFDIDYALPDVRMNHPFRILFIGKATAEFMIVINALQKKNVEVVAAFTSFSAFDYLHDRNFDAVVMNTLTDVEPAFTISDTMRRNSKLYHVPTLFLVNPQTFDQHSDAFKKGASDIINADDDLDEISGRILELANYHRTHQTMKREFVGIGSEATLDSETGLFNLAFLKAHLSRMMGDMKRADLPLSLFVMKTRPDATTPVSDMALARANRQIGAMTKNLVRMQDCVARLSPNTFAIAFVGQSRVETQTVLERIHNIIDCTAFDHEQAQMGPFMMTIQSALVDMLGYETAEQLIEHAHAEIGLSVGNAALSA